MARLDTKLIMSTGHKVAKFPCQTKIIYLFQPASLSFYQFFFFFNQSVSNIREQLPHSLEIVLSETLGHCY